MRKTNIHTYVHYKFIGIDCEMVLSTEGFDILARVAIVTEDDVLIDSFVRTDLEIEDYRTEVSGVRPEDISSAPHIDEILPRVRDILEDALIIVGHDLVHDMEVLGVAAMHTFSQLDLKESRVRHEAYSTWSEGKNGATICAQDCSRCARLL